MAIPTGFTSTTKFTILADPNTCPSGTEVPYPTVTTSQPAYQWSVWCQTCLATFPYPHTCPKLNVDISKQYPTLSLETRILQLEARILNQQDFISQLADRIQALENPVLISQHSYDCLITGVSAHTEHLCPCKQFKEEENQ